MQTLQMLVALYQLPTRGQQAAPQQAGAHRTPLARAPHLLQLTLSQEVSQPSSRRQVLVAAWFTMGSMHLQSASLRRRVPLSRVTLMTRSMMRRSPLRAMSMRESMKVPAKRQAAMTGGLPF
jgi:hypothetical protein